MALKTINDLTELTTPAATDLVGVWAVGAARMRKSTIAQVVSTALLTGHSGGRAIYGGTDANDDLTLEGTAHATKTSSYVTLQPTGGKVGIGTSLTFLPVAAPGACTAALAGAGAGDVDDGTHFYVITFVTAEGETELLNASNTVTVANKAANGKVALTGIPIGGARVTGRKIYRSKANITIGRVALHLLATIGNNTTTTYIDNTADASLGATSATEKENTTAGMFYLNDTISGIIGVSSDTALGFGVLASNTTGGGNAAFGATALTTNTSGTFNVAVGFQAMKLNESGSWNTASGDSALRNNASGSYNNAYGQQALLGNLTGNYNVAIGNAALLRATAADYNVAVGIAAMQNTTGSSNVAIGHQALLTNTTGVTNVAVGFNAGYTNSAGASCVFLGAHAGYYETASDKLFIDSYIRGNENDARVKALIYGVFAPTTAAQSVTVNGLLTGREGLRTAKDWVYAAGADLNAQLKIASASNTFQLELGADGTNYKSYIQSAAPGSNYYPLHINPGGGNIILGTATVTIVNATNTLSMADGAKLSFGTTTGTQIGTSASEKLAFHGSTPIVKPTGVAVTADAIHAALVNLGLIAA